MGIRHMGYFTPIHSCFSYVATVKEYDLLLNECMNYQKEQCISPVDLSYQGLFLDMRRHVSVVWHTVDGDASA